MLEKSVAHHVVETLLAENRREQKEIEGNLKDPDIQSSFPPEELDKDTKRHIGDYVENIIRETIHKNAGLV